VRNWLQGRLDALHSSDADPVLPLTRQFIDVLHDTAAVLTPISSISQYFARLGVDYYKIASIACDSKVPDIGVRLWHDSYPARTRRQWRTEGGGLGGLETPHWRTRKRQNMVFSIKNTKNFLGRGTPLPQTPYQQGGGYPLPITHPLGACSTLTPHSKILGTPLPAGYEYGYRSLYPYPYAGTRYPFSQCAVLVFQVPVISLIKEIDN